MGGALDVPGNVNPYAEANIYGDARAADLVMSAGFNMILVGLDVTMKTFITNREIQNLCKNCRDECRPIADYIRDVLKFYFEFHRATPAVSYTHLDVYKRQILIRFIYEISLGTLI